MPTRTRSVKTDVLAHVPLFAACTSKELALIASITDEVDVAAGHVLAREGRPGGEFFIVVSGRATAFQGDQDLATFGPGGFFGEMALLDGGPRSATVVADEPMHLLVVDPRNFVRLVDETPTVARKMLRVLAERVRTLEEAWLG